MNEASEEVANGGIRKSARISARILKGVALFEKGVERDSSTIVAMTSHDVTMKHATRTNKLERSLITLSSITNGEGVLKWVEQLKRSRQSQLHPKHIIQRKSPKNVSFTRRSKDKIKEATL